MSNLLVQMGNAHYTLHNTNQFAGQLLEYFNIKITVSSLKTGNNNQNWSTSVKKKRKNKKKKRNKKGGSAYSKMA